MKKVTAPKKLTPSPAIRLLLLLLVVSAAISGCTHHPDETDLSKEIADFHFIDVGQGDSTLIISPGGTMLIDTGGQSAVRELKDYLTGLKVERIDYLVLTHPHEDHIGNASMVIENFTVENVLLPNAVATTRAYENMLTAIENSDACVIEAISGEEYTLGDLAFKVLAPNSMSYEDLNNYSVVLRITYGDTSFLMTGDAEEMSEAEILARYDKGELTCDVLKVGHHGSDTSTSSPFLSAVSPAVAIISCGKNNSYGHPHIRTLRKLEDIGCTILRTDDIGSILLRTDKREIRLISD